jgi:predicted RNA-binding Zn-ribbon protein involved in translation (DUF1610 family)
MIDHRKEHKVRWMDVASAGGHAHSGSGDYQTARPDRPAHGSQRCPSCGIELPVKPEWAGRKLMCPHCSEVVRIPRSVALAEETTGPADAPAIGPSIAWELFTSLSEPRNLGLTSMGVALVCILLLCIPAVGYAAIPLSGLGILMGLVGVGLALRGGWREIRYPLAGIGASLLALTLALLPHLLGTG